MIDAKSVKNLRDETGAPVMEVKKALEEANGEFERAKEILKELGAARVQKRQERQTSQGVIEAYTHADRKIGVIVEVNCETDFVAKTEEFKTFAHEIALQVAAMNPTSVEELLDQEYIRDEKRKIKDLLNELISKTGENVKINRFVRYDLGKD